MKPITLTNTLQKTYTLFDKNEKHYLIEREYESVFIRRLKFASFNKDAPHQCKPTGMSLECALQLQESVKASAPIDIRVWMNAIEVVNNAEKLAIFNDLVLMEIATNASTTLNPVSAKTMKSIKEETAIRQKTQLLLNSRLFNLSTLSLNECKKLQTVLTSK